MRSRSRRCDQLATQALEYNAQLQDVASLRLAVALSAAPIDELQRHDDVNEKDASAVKSIGVSMLYDKCQHVS